MFCYTYPTKDNFRDLRGKPTEHEVRSDVITSQDLELLLRSERCTAPVRRFSAEKYPRSEIMLWWDRHLFYLLQITLSCAII